MPAILDTALSGRVLFSTPGGVVEPTVQQVVDDLAAQVGRPVIAEDRSLRLIAYSSQDQAVDAVREVSILRRRASGAVTRWLDELGVRQARRPVRVPANPDLGMLPRICIPIRWKDRLLGHLWFIDADEQMRPDRVDIGVQMAARLAAILHRGSVAETLAAARLADTVQALLSSPSTASEAARILEADGDLVAPDGVVAVVVQGRPTAPGWTVDIEEPLSEMLAGYLPAARHGSVVSVVRKDHCVLLVATPSEHGDRLDRWIAGLSDAVRAEVAARHAPVSIGLSVGGHRRRLDAAAESYREARMAADAAAVLPGIGDLVYWSDLGVNQVVVKLASLGERPAVLHAGLQALLDSPEARPMLETLETYLDVAGNAQLTAERLNLHRTSLYYRLQRVEQLANTDLKDGQERLALHLAIKLARLTGEYDGDTGIGKPPRPQLSTRAG